MTEAECEALVREFVGAHPDLDPPPKEENGKLMLHESLSDKFARWAFANGHGPKLAAFSDGPPARTLTDAEFRVVVDQFLKDRPDLTNVVRDINGVPYLNADALPAFTLWSVERGFSPPEAFGRAIDLRDGLKRMSG